MSDSSINAIACLHPLKIEHQRVVLPAGLSIDEMIRQAQPRPELRQAVHVHVNGRYIHPERWDVIFPTSADWVEFRMVPRDGGGGGDKDPMRTVLTIAVVAGSLAISGGALAPLVGGGWLAAGSISASLAATAFSVGGMLAVNAIAPPPSQGQSDPNISGREDDSPSYNIEGTRNQLRPYKPIRRSYGVNRIFPDLGAKPYSQFEGDDQYFVMVFVWGYGPQDIRDEKINETPITEYSDYELEHRRGDGDDTPFKNFPNVVNERSIGSLLKESDGYVTRTTETNTTKIGVVVSFPNGCVEFNDDGSRSSRTVEIEVQYAPAGTGDWSLASGQYHSVSSKQVSLNWGRQVRYVQINQDTGNIFVDKSIRRSSIPIAKAEPRYNTYRVYGEPGGSRTTVVGTDVTDIRPSDAPFQNDADFAPQTGEFDSLQPNIDIDGGDIYREYLTVVQATTSAVRRQLLFDPGDPGQYDVRVKRITPDSTGNQVYDEVYWSLLQSIEEQDPVQRYDVAASVLKIKATDQLNGVIDRFNAINESELLTYIPEEGGWVQALCSDPAAAFRDALQGNAIGKPLPDDRVDIDGLEDFSEHCLDNGWEVNLVIEKRDSVRAKLRDIAAAGRAGVATRDGVWGVIIDREKTAYDAFVSPRNSWNYQGRRDFGIRVHALKVRFRNRKKGYKQDVRLVYDDGYDETNATEIREIQRPDVTDPDLAWRHGRRHLAELKLRPITHVYRQDMEHIKAPRGGLVCFAHTVPLIGIQQCRIKAVVNTDGDDNIEEINVDDICTMESDKTYSIRVRHADDTQSYHDVETVAGENQTLTLSNPVPIVDAPAKDDLLMFGESEAVNKDLIVKRIKPINDRDAEVECVDAAPGIHTADSGAIPQYDPLITAPPQPDPPQPQVENVRSGGVVMYRDQDGSLRPRIVVDFKIDSNREEIVGRFQVEYREISESSYTHVKDLGSDARMFDLREVEQGLSYDIRIRSINREGDLQSAWTTVQDHVVVGKTGPPSDVVGITAETTNWIDSGSKVYGIRLSWDEAPDKDIGRYEVRLADQNWGVRNSELVARPLDNSIQVPIATAGTHTFYLKAVDTSGNYSANAAPVSVTIDAPGAVSGLSSSFTGGNLVLTWTGVQGSFPIAYFEVRRGSSQWATASFVATIQATRFSETPDWSGTEDWLVAGVDVAGNVGTPQATDVTINPPGKPDDLTSRIFSNDVMLFWTNNPGTLPISHHELWRDDNKDANFGDSTNVYISDNPGSYASYAEAKAGFFSYFAVPVDIIGNKGTAAKASVYVNEPPEFLLQSEFYTDFMAPRSNVVRAEPEQFHHVLFDGQDDYAAIDYSYASGSISAFTVEARIETLTDGIIISFDQSEYWRLEIGGNAASGNLGASLYDSANSTFENLDSGYFVADGLPHYVGLRFDSGAVTFLVDGTSVASFSIGSTVGSGITRYGFLGVGSEAGVYNGTKGPEDYFKGKMAEFRLWSVARTDAEIVNNIYRSLSGDETGLEVYYRLDYVSGASTLHDYTGNGRDGEVFNGLRIRRPEVAVRGPFDRTETWEDHFVGTGDVTSPQWTDMQSLIDAGYTEYLQPGTPTSGYVEEVFDIGTVLTSTQIKVGQTITALAGSPSVTTTIYAKENRGDAWTSETGTRAFFNNVRYVKIRWDISGSSDSDLVEIADVKVSLTVQRKTEEGTAYLDAGDSPSTVISISEEFTTVTAITATPRGDVNYAIATDWTNPQPTEFQAVMYDSSGNRVSGNISYTIRGV